MRWRALKPSREASPSTPSRSTTPSAINRIARPATSASTSHSGDPGEAPGRQRLQARKPAACAEAAVRWNVTLAALGVRAGHEGRQ